MKTNRKWIAYLLSFVLFVASLPMSTLSLTASAEKSGDFEYEILGDGNVIITRYTNAGGDVVIPETINGRATTVIGNSAFSDCKGLRSVIIGDSISVIGESAFNGCTGLTSITIGKSVTEIGFWAFGNCIGLTSVVFPDNVNRIGESAFAGCTGLRAVKFGNGMTTIANRAFNNCTALTTITIEEGLTTIGESAFANCKNLGAIEIPDSVTVIGNYAFTDCEGLKSVIIGDGLTAINEGTFNGCTGLTSVTIGKSVTEIGYSAFGGCIGLTTMVIPDSVTKIGAYAFSECTGLKAIEFGSGITNILDSAFNSCMSLQFVYYNSIFTIWDYVNIERNNQPLINAKLCIGKMPSSIPDIDSTEHDNKPTIISTVPPTTHTTTYNSEPTVPQENPVLSPIAGSDIIVDETDKTVIIDMGTDFALFVSQVNNVNITLLQANSQPLAAGMLIGTGCSVQVLNEGGFAFSTYEILVPMDVSGDGRITSADARTILRKSIGLE